MQITRVPASWTCSSTQLVSGQRVSVVIVANHTMAEPGAIVPGDRQSYPIQYVERYRLIGPLSILLAWTWWLYEFVDHSTMKAPLICKPSNDWRCLGSSRFARTLCSLEWSPPPSMPYAPRIVGLSRVAW